MAGEAAAGAAFGPGMVGRDVNAPRFHDGRVRDSLAPMFWLHLRRLLATLVVAGLIAGPFAASAVVGATEPSWMTAAADQSMAEDMASDMPCCPPEKPAMPDCHKGCPLLGLCFAKCPSLSPLLSQMPVPLPALGDLVVPQNDVMGDARAIAPPARPPRT